MLDMSMSPEWREISVHRDAGLAGQLNIETVLQQGFDSPLAGMMKSIAKGAR